MTTARVLAALALSCHPGPSIDFATYVGGRGADDCDAVAVDPAGYVHLGCHSDSPDLGQPAFPDLTLHGDLDAFVLKLDPSGQRLIYLTQIGGRGWDAVQGIALDGSGSAYVVGTTYSPDLPTTPGALARRYGGGEGDAFVARLSPDGALEYLTYLGGAGADDGRRIAVQRDGTACVVGRTNSADFPTTRGVVQETLGGGMDAFVTCLDPDGGVTFSTYLGGSRPDVAMGIALDSRGQPHVTGLTQSPDFPTVRPLQAGHAGESDVFVAALSRSGHQLLFATLYGGPGWEEGSAIALDRHDRAYVAGVARSPGFPSTAGVFQPTNRGRADGLIIKLAAGGGAVLYATLLGGSAEDSPTAIAIGGAGQVFVVGGTESPDFPVSRAVQAVLRGTKDGFVAVLDSAGRSLPFSTYLGGSERELFEDAALDAEGGLVVAGLTNSGDFPTRRSHRRRSTGGLYDIVLLRLLP